jgi:hypothetical protein
MARRRRTPAACMRRCSLARPQAGAAHAASIVAYYCTSTSSTTYTWRATARVNVHNSFMLLPALLCCRSHAYVPSNLTARECCRPSAILCGILIFFLALIYRKYYSLKFRSVLFIEIIVKTKLRNDFFSRRAFNQQVRGVPSEPAESEM